MRFAGLERLRKNKVQNWSCLDKLLPLKRPRCLTLVLAGSRVGERTNFTKQPVRNIKVSLVRTRWSRRVSCVASPSSVQETGKTAPSSPANATDDAVAYLKAAASGRRLPPEQVLSAILALEKAKLPADDFLDVLSGHGKEGGKRWRLVFNAGKEQVNEASKGGKGGGLYFPLTAVQRWDSNTEVIENGVYLGQVAALTFRGPFVMNGRKLTFTFDKLRIRLGPKWLEFPLQAGQLGTTANTDDKKSPFFLFIYADDDVAVARGRGGGLAFWARTSPAWEASSGVDL